jgi:alkanesulfonate monooxygenase SsuD/methylene tetrahydromethanopterin reductase-like flavin-dependent oxidoreductase (luciferase family)
VRLNLVLATILGLALAAWAAPAARAQGSIVDTQWEVTTAVVQSSLIEVAGRHADVYALWGESLAAVADTVARVRAAAARHGRADHVRPAASIRLLANKRWAPRPAL